MAKVLIPAKSIGMLVAAGALNGLQWSSRVSLNRPLRYRPLKIGLEFPQRYYPRSFLGLLLLAFLLVAAPLIIAFYNAAVYVEQLAGQSQTAVSQAARASRGSRLLVEQTTALERIVRQYLILDDEDLLKDYARLRSNFKTNTSELSLQPLDEVQLAELNSTIDMEQALYEQLMRKPASPAGEDRARGRLHGPFGHCSQRAQYEQRPDRPRSGIHAEDRRARAAHSVAAARGNDSPGRAPRNRRDHLHREADPPARPGDSPAGRGRVRGRASRSSGPRT